MKPIVLLSGPVSAGKSELANGLCARFGGHRFSTREILLSNQRKEEQHDRRSLQRRGSQLDRQTDGRWVVDALATKIAELGDDVLIVIDSVRLSKQIDGFRVAFGRRVVHIHLTASEAELARRYRRRKPSDVAELATYKDVIADATEAQVKSLASDADVVINTERCTKDDVLVRAFCRLGLNGSPEHRLVDVLVGGQYGSEGKGNIVSYIAPEYPVLVRVGGPNAGHKVFGPKGEVFTHHQLPSGTLKAPDARIVIGPGAVLNIDKLLGEIAACKVEVERLTIDPQAMVISGADIREERKTGGLVQTIASTGQGVGAATARKIRHRHRQVTLAKHVPAVRAFIREAADALEQAYSRGERILLEGTQGTGLSLHHGSYPHVTSRDTTASGTLAEAGIPPGRVRKVIMTTRTYPIRVGNPQGGSSGWMSQPLSWAEISRRSGLEVNGLRKSERTSTTKRKRRVAEFDWALLRRSSMLNNPTDIALTFVDYVDKRNQEARRFDQLTPETVQFIEEVERVAEASVSLISTRFDPRCIIDRRNW